MRRIVTLTLTATLVLLALPRDAEAHHLPNSYCSSTGDICQSVRRVNGIRWHRHFPNKGPGAYVVTWSSGGHRVGARLGFHVRVA